MQENVAWDGTRDADTHPQQQRGLRAHNPRFCVLEQTHCDLLERQRQRFVIGDIAADSQAAAVKCEPARREMRVHVPQPDTAREQRPGRATEWDSGAGHTGAGHGRTADAWDHRRNPEAAHPQVPTRRDAAAHCVPGCHTLVCDSYRQDNHTRGHWCRG